MAEGQFVEHPKSRRPQACAVWDVAEQRFRYPAFQFKEGGELRPEMEELHKLLPADRSGWRQAFWLYQPHERLAGARPVNVFAMCTWTQGSSPTPSDI